MKRKIIKISLFVIFGLFIFTGGVVAAKLTAKDISFTSINEEWNVNNVEEAVNELYDMAETNDSMLPIYTYVFSTGVNPGANRVIVLKNTYDFDPVNIMSIYATRHSSSTSGTLHIALSDQPLTSFEQIKTSQNYYSYKLQPNYLTRPSTPFVADTTNVKGEKYINLYAETTGEYTHWYMFDLILDK